MSTRLVRGAPRGALVALSAAGVAACLLLLGEEAESQATAGPFTARSCDHRTPISSLPYTISSSGSYYLAAELTGMAGSHGITVDADDVTIDLAGFGLRGVPGSLDGIHVANGPREHLRVFGGWIEGWGEDGVDAQVAAYTSWRSLRIANNAGFGLYAAEGALVRECAFENNGDTGLRTGGASVVSHASSRDNFTYGIRSAGVLWMCDVEDSGDDGFVLDDAAVVRACRAQSTGGSALRTASEAVILETIVGSGGGIQTGAGGFGQPCLVARCRLNGGSGSRMFIGFANYLYDNVVTGAPAAEAFLIAGDHSRVDSNQVSGCDYGFQTGGSADGNLFVRNSAATCTTANYDILAGNPAGPIVALPGPGSTWCNFDL